MQGIHRHAIFKLAGRTIGEHRGYLTPFEADVTDAIRARHRAAAAEGALTLALISAPERARHHPTRAVPCAVLGGDA